MKPTNELLEELSKTLGEDIDALRETTLKEFSLRARINKPKRDRSKNKAAKKARRENR